MLCDLVNGGLAGGPFVRISGDTMTGSLGIGYATGAAPAQSLVVAGNIGIGLANPNPLVLLEARGTVNINGSGRSFFVGYDTTAFALGVGSGMTFGGKFNSAGAVADFGIISGVKQTAVDGDYAGRLTFHTRPFGGVFEEKLSIGSDGQFIFRTTGGAVSAWIADGIHAVPPGYGAGVLPAGFFYVANDPVPSGWGVARVGMVVAGNTPFGIEEGNGIAFAGNYTTGTADDRAEFGIISGLKENATNGNYAGIMTFYTRPNGGSWTERMRISSAGNIGIGTTTAHSLLEVAGGIQAGDAAFTSDFGYGMSLFGPAQRSLYFSRTTGAGGNSWVWGNANSVGNGDFAIVDISVTANPYLAIIGASGNIGFSTISPQSKLDIVGNLTIGANYGGVNAAPTSGAIIEGRVGIGTNSPNANALLDLVSTTLGFKLPNMTSAQKNAIANTAGLMVFDTNLGKACVNSGAGWETITSV